VQVKSTDDDRPIRFVTDERLDFDHAAPFRQAYFVASSYRCGSQYLCWRLWQTGLLGAPSEVLAPTNELRIFMNRFKTSSPAEYIAKLVARRTSRNGVFGMKAHFHHFEAFLKDYPALLEVLAPMTYIYISREDRIAQAVSMAKALQTGRWTSRMEGASNAPLQYDREMIANCLEDIMQQDVNWRRWFESHNVTPFEVTYNQVATDAAGVVRGVVELLGVENDEPDEVSVPPVKKQGDETNQEWIERFERETKAGGTGRKADAGGGEERGLAADAGSGPSTAGGHFFDRYERLIKSLSEGANSATGFIDSIRLRRRYDAIIAQNRGLFRNARVLDLVSSQGFWSLAALDAGAAHVVGIEPSQKLVQESEKNFAEYGIRPGSYRLIRASIFPALETFGPEAFDVILCKGFFERCHFTQFFEHLSRLRPKHIVLDTRIAPGHGPTARFAISSKARKGRDARIMSIPNHELIDFFCEFEFRWRLVDWQAMGITDWTGVQDYARDTHRTYVLDHQP
jgi:trehalose 2-sulfotransferase